MGGGKPHFAITRVISILRDFGTEGIPGYRKSRTWEFEGEEKPGRGDWADMES